jgi:hypothetical protein
MTLIIIKYLENFEETRWVSSLMMSGEEDVKDKMEENKV